MISFEHVTKIYRDGLKPALNNVKFFIDRGEFVFLVGASGSGKSTLLSLILRAERANEGTIQVAGRDLGTLSNWRVPKYRQQLGIIFQNYRLLPNKTVSENVAFALQVIGKPRYAVKTMVPEALEKVGLADKGDRYPHELSGGEQQRVAIARAIVNKPLIIIADEPTGNLDPATSDEVMQVLEKISRSGTTILMATHSEEIVNRYQKRVIELSQGKLVRDEENAVYDSDAAYEREHGKKTNRRKPAATAPRVATSTKNPVVPASAPVPITAQDPTSAPRSIKPKGDDVNQTVKLEVGPITQPPLPAAPHQPADSAGVSQDPYDSLSLRNQPQVQAERDDLDVVFQTGSFKKDDHFINLFEGQQDTAQISRDTGELR